MPDEQGANSSGDFDDVASWCFGETQVPAPTAESADRDPRRRHSDLRGIAAPREQRGGVILEAVGVSIDIAGKRLVDDVSLTVFPKELVAVMGPSGAGKSMLLSALNGYLRPAEGEVRFNRRNLHDHYSLFRDRIGYVPQDDILHQDLTVAQALYYSAKLRLPARYTDQQIHGRIRDILRQLGLQGAENVRVGSPEKRGISGGQRKRVNLAMELLTNPSILFLDEPTSGLSSEEALSVIRVLRLLADSGKTILVTIHQPSLEMIRLMDNLAVIARDSGSTQPGRLAYYGPAYPESVHFFNPEGVPGLRQGTDPWPDEILKGLSHENTLTWVERYRTSDHRRLYIDERLSEPNKGAVLPTAAPTSQPVRQQWRTLVRRALALKAKDTWNTVTLCIQAPLVAVLITLVFGEQMSKAVTNENWPDVARATGMTMFLMVLSSIWLGCSNAAREIVGEWAIYRRERMVSLRISSYIASKVAVLGMLCAFQCAVMLSIVMWGNSLETAWWKLYLFLFLVALVGLTMGLSISALSPSTETAIALLPIIILPMVILGGAMEPIHRMNPLTQNLCKIVPARWGFEGILILESTHRPLWDPKGMPRDPQDYAPDKIGPKFEVKAQDMAEHDFPIDHRERVRTCFIYLSIMLFIAITATATILRMRDLA